MDVYINDGRNGEYEYKYDHWNNTSVWNRNMPDEGMTHQSAIIGARLCLCENQESRYHCRKQRGRERLLLPAGRRTDLAH